MTLQQQVADRFSALMRVDREEYDEWKYELDAIVAMLSTVRELGRLINCIPELFSLDYGIGRELPHPYSGELEDFCNLLMVGNRVAACEAIPQIHILVRNLPEQMHDQGILSESDKDTMVALAHAGAAVFFYECREGGVPVVSNKVITPEYVIKPFCIAVFMLLLAHRKEGGSMNSILELIANRIAANLGSVQ